MKWNSYFNAKPEKRWDMLQRENRLSYDHVDNWLMSLRAFLKQHPEEDSETYVLGRHDMIKEEVLWLQSVLDTKHIAEDGRWIIEGRILKLNSIIHPFAKDEIKEQEVSK